MVLLTEAAPAILRLPVHQLIVFWGSVFAGLLASSIASTG
jgi:hypothetical protein